jgi:hypothetical protein
MPAMRHAKLTTESVNSAISVCGFFRLQMRELGAFSGEVCSGSPQKMRPTKEAGAFPIP